MKDDYIQKAIERFRKKFKFDGDILGPLSKVLMFTLLVIGIIFWKPITAIVIYKDARCIFAECRLSK